MIDPKKNGNRTLRVRYDSGAILVGPAITDDEGRLFVSLGGASSLLVRRADGSLPLHVAAVETPPEDDGPCLDAALAVFDETTSDGSVGIRIPDGSFKTGLLPDGSMPEGVESVSIRPKHPKGVLPLTDDMVYMAVTVMLRDAAGLTLGEASDAYESWLNRVRRAAIEDWVDSLPERESTRLHRRYLDRDAAGRPEEEGDA